MYKYDLAEGEKVKFIIILMWVSIYTRIYGGMDSYFPKKLIDKIILKYFPLSLSSITQI